MDVQSLRDIAINELKSPCLLLEKKCRENAESKESESSCPQTSRLELFLCENGLLSVQSQSQNAMKKSWSPRFLRKGKCHDNPDLKGSESSSKQAINPEISIGQYENGHLLAQAQSQNVMKKSWSPRFLRKRKTHENPELKEK